MDEILKDVYIWSVFSEEKTLNFNGSNVGRVVTFENDEDSSAVLVGFTIMNGYTTYSRR